MLKKWLIGLASLAAIPTLANAQQATQAAAVDRFVVPPTVSPEASAALTAVYTSLKTYFAKAAQLHRPRPASVEEWDAQNAPREAAMLARTANLLKRVGVVAEKDTIGGVSVVRLRRVDRRPSERILIYLHGGGYVSYSAQSDITVAALVAAESGDEVISVDYTLAPRGTWQTVTDQFLAVWRALLAKGRTSRTMGLFGASAGGGLAAASVLKMRDQNLPLPAALYLISPWTDITPTGDTIATLAAADPILSSETLGWGADAYAAPADQKNPYVSPVYGDYTKPFPPTLIQVGTREILLSDAVREYQAIRSGNHEAVLDVYEGMPHVWQALMSTIPETRISITRAVSFLHSHLAAK